MQRFSLFMKLGGGGGAKTKVGGGGLEMVLIPRNQSHPQLLNPPFIYLKERDIIFQMRSEVSLRKKTWV